MANYVIDRSRRFAWLIILIVDAGVLLWRAMAALVPEHLLGPGSTPILAAGYEGFTSRIAQRGKFIGIGLVRAD